MKYLTTDRTPMELNFAEEVLIDGRRYILTISRECDYESIKHLLSLCFGVRKHNLENLNGRYHLLWDYETNMLVSMYGDTKKYHNKPGIMLECGCTHPDYQRKGIQTFLIRKLVSENNCDIWVSAWRLPNNEKANAAIALERAGFKLYKSRSMFWTTMLTCKFNCETCVYYHNYGKGCHCYEDLYYRPAGI